MATRGIGSFDLLSEEGLGEGEPLNPGRQVEDRRPGSDHLCRGRWMDRPNWSTMREDPAKAFVTAVPIAREPVEAIPCAAVKSAASFE